MKKRKTLAMGLAVAMAVSCLAGCGEMTKKLVLTEKQNRF